MVNKEKTAHNSDKAFCIMPWVHLHVSQNGNVIPCCQAPPHKVHRFGNINEENIATIWNAEPIQIFRQKMLIGEKDARCKQCYLKEQNGLKSLRQKTNEVYLNENIVLTTKTELNPVYFDIRFSNACNLKCRICGPWASSQWHKDAVELGMRKQGDKALTVAIKDEDCFFEEMKPFFKNAKEFYFAGGEPLMMEQHYRVLDALLEAGNHNVQLNYNTNFSKLDFKNYRVIDYWKQFQHIKISASLDAEKERGELLRKNIIWNKVIENRKLLINKLSHIEFEVNPTICVFNVEHIPEFHKNWVNQRLISVEDFIPNILINPKEYQINVLPIKNQLTIKEKYINHIKWIKSQSFTNSEKIEIVLTQFNSIIEQLGKKSNESIVKTLEERIVNIDQLRSESTIKVFPEIKNLLNIHVESE